MKFKLYGKLGDLIIAEKEFNNSKINHDQKICDYKQYLKHINLQFKPPIFQQKSKNKHRIINENKNQFLENIRIPGISKEIEILENCYKLKEKYKKINSRIQRKYLKEISNTKEKILYFKERSRSRSKSPKSKKKARVSLNDFKSSKGSKYNKKSSSHKNKNKVNKQQISQFSIKSGINQMIKNSKKLIAQKMIENIKFAFDD